MRNRAGTRELAGIGGVHNPDSNNRDLYMKRGSAVFYEHDFQELKSSLV